MKTIRDFLTILVALAALAVVLAIARGAGAQDIVKYVDDAGVTHFVGSIDQVPETYRMKTQRPDRLPPVTATDHDGGVSEGRRKEWLFNQAASECAGRARVQIFHKPGAKAVTFGTEKAQFEFNKCMSQRDQPTE